MKELKLDDIVLDDNTVLTVDKFLQYGTTLKYFAVVGDDLYHQSGVKDFYRLLKKNYMKGDTK